LREEGALREEELYEEGERGFAEEGEEALDTDKRP
jgi:hypothetical protein